MKELVLIAERMHNVIVKGLKRGYNLDEDCKEELMFIANELNSCMFDDKGFDMIRIALYHECKMWLAY